MASKDDKKRKKKKEQLDDVTVEDEKTDKEEKNVKKRKKDSISTIGSIDDTDDDNDQKSNRSTNKKIKKAEKEALLAKLPQTNELGLPYTKIQIRKMLKRVKKGLAPIPSKEEQHELNRAKKEEERELENMMFSKDDEDDDLVVGAKDYMVVEDGDGTDQEDLKDDDEGEREDEGDGSKSKSDEDNSSSLIDKSNDAVTAAQKKKARVKPVPCDYLCYACKNAHEPRHWIYDCPNKVTVKGTNKVKKKLRGVNDPDAKKVFVSGLPYDVSRGDICKYFEIKCKDKKIAGCKTLSFSDTGRFNGQAYISFETDDGAKTALTLNGKVFEGLPDAKEGEGEAKKNKKSQRWLKVTKVLSRAVTKKISKTKSEAENVQ